jgi:hypothetical protein
LWTRPFVLHTDHYSLKYLLDQRLSTILQHTWVSKLFGYQFMVEFKPGHQNAAADALSCCDEEQVSVHVPSLPTFDIVDQFRQESMTLQEIITMKAQIKARTAGKAWAVVDGIVVHDGHIFMPASSKL